MTTQPDSEADFQLRKLLASEQAEDLLDHPWAWEGARWNELVFALLRQVLPPQDEALRDLVEWLSELELLGMNELDGLWSDNAIRSDEPHARRILGELQAAGIAAADAEAALAAIVDAAHALCRRYDGRIQKYVRRYAETLLNEVGDDFRFRSLSQDAAAAAFTVWLQNCFNMPLSLIDESMVAFAKAHGLSTTELIDAADRAGFNVAFVDDLIQVVEAEERLMEAQPEKPEAGHGPA